MPFSAGASPSGSTPDVSRPLRRFPPAPRPEALLLGALLLAGFALASTVVPGAARAEGWAQLPNGPRAGFSIGRHDDLWFIDENQGWVVNGEGDVIRTQDGGDSWSVLTYTGAYNRCVGFLNAQHGYIGTLYQVNGQALLETNDGGLTWAPVPLPEPIPRGLCGMEVIPPNIVTAVGTYYGYPSFLRSDDAGATWTVRDLSAQCGALVDIHWLDPQNGIVVGSTAPGPTRHTIILRTQDGGATWSVRWTGTRNKEICWKISFVSSLVGFVSVENLNATGAVYFLKTVDGGQTWSEVLVSPDYLNFQGIGFLTEYYGWLGGWNIGCYITQNGGGSWTWKNFGYHVNRIRFLSPTLGYAVGRDIYKYTGFTSDVAEAPAPAAGRLGPNTPNPFRGATRIPYSVATTGLVTLRVFDPQGRPVRELFSGARAAGDYTAEFDARDLAAGTYYVKLESADGIETRKVQLLR